MKLDYDFIKKLLITMEEYPNFCIGSIELMEKLKISSEKDIDKFIGHILLLGDNGVIYCDNEKYKYGLIYFLGGSYQVLDVRYRLTAQGYEFLDMLNNDTVFNKIKNFAISNGFDIGKQILISLVTGGLNG